MQLERLKKFSINNVSHVTEGTILKKIKVSNEERISIPAEMRKAPGIRKGDDLQLLRNGDRLLIEKPSHVVQHLENDISAMMTISEASLKKLWLSKKEVVWNRYLED
ncbi:MAG: AbrB/MazE/SpoVT family DNA-binding domain-containing protein [Thermoplasmata archaeon]|nr:AbrB/MazE/SpoVT family DNA-binding domain-containing protein [Candidatus Sysuiplasma acidicola]MBX8647047.1 AbrB/MazE/SpoVT family DNA-binding domain-containing protein [Candidatus Sysuiplasma acidicola]